MNAFWLCLTGSDSADAKVGGLFYSGRPVIRKALELADHVLQDSPDQRLKMPVCMDASDEEAEDEEMMEVKSNVKYIFLASFLKIICSLCF